MFGLEPQIVALLFLCLLCACAFEFVNGFHDTANAVATVIYTNSLPPRTAVVWSGICNFAGVMLGGITVAMGIVALLPMDALLDIDLMHGIAMILALLLSAIIWNLGTWYFGLPSSSSHTLIGSIVGVGLAYSFLPGSTSTVNWAKVSGTGSALLLSPILGFGATLLLVWAIKLATKNSPVLFSEPVREVPPPPFVRGILIATCTLVSFFHGNNDGQKGVGLVMLILIVIVPAHFAINAELQPFQYRDDVKNITVLVSKIKSPNLTEKEAEDLAKFNNLAEATYKAIEGYSPEIISTDNARAVGQNRFEIRKDLILITKTVDGLLKTEHTDGLTAKEVDALRGHNARLKDLTDYAPFWVTLMISISLGVGTMIGWKRIVLTIGEKIGKQHLTYAQGAGAELIAASTIGLSSQFGLPVSTTHVLSSGIAGSMFATNGAKNLQWGTVRSILLAWVLTLPVSMLLSGGLFLLFRVLL